MDFQWLGIMRSMVSLAVVGFWVIMGGVLVGWDVVF